MGGKYTFGNDAWENTRDDERISRLRAACAASDPIEMAEELLGPTRREFDASDPDDELGVAMDTRAAVLLIGELYQKTKSPEVRMSLVKALVNTTRAEEDQTILVNALEELKKIWKKTGSPEVKVYYAWALRNTVGHLDDDKVLDAVETARALWEDGHDPAILQHYALALYDLSHRPDVIDADSAITRLEGLWKSTGSADVALYYANTLFNQTLGSHKKPEMHLKYLALLKDLWEHLCGQVDSGNDEANDIALVVCELYANALELYSVYCNDIEACRKVIAEFQPLWEKAEGTSAADKVAGSYALSLHNLAASVDDPDEKLEISSQLVEISKYSTSPLVGKLREKHEARLGQ